MKTAGKKIKDKSFVQGRMMKGAMALLLVAGLTGHAFAAPGNSGAVAASASVTTPTPIPTTATSTPLPAPEITPVAATSANADTVAPATSAPAVQPLTAPAPQGLAMDLSVWGMYQHADVVVKGVMIGLVLASIVTWTILFSKRY